MCYAKPGPRCSTHALATYVRTAADPDQPNLQVVTRDLDATPAGAADLTVLRLWAEDAGLARVVEDVDDRLVDARVHRRRAWQAMGKTTDGALALDRAAARTERDWARMDAAEREALLAEVIDRQGPGHAARSGSEIALRDERPGWLDQSRTDAVFSPGPGPVDLDGIRFAAQMAAARSIANAARNGSDPDEARRWRSAAVTSFDEFAQTRTGRYWVTEHARGDRPMGVSEFDRSDDAATVALGRETGSEPLPLTGQERRGWGWPEARERLLNHVGESAAWVATLTNEERDAVAYWTSGGAGIIGGWVHRQSDTLREEFTPRSAARYMQTLSAALDKARSDQPRVVWRGLSNNTMRSVGDTEDGRRSRDEAGLDWALAAHPVGSVVDFKTPGSASADPTKAHGFSGFPSVVFEVRTRYGAPVSAVSAWGASEREVLLPHTRRFRVVSVSDEPFRLPSLRSGERVEPTTVIQLEDC